MRGDGLQKREIKIKKTLEHGEEHGAGRETHLGEDAILFYCTIYLFIFRLLRGTWSSRTRDPIRAVVVNEATAAASQDP